ncbi:cold-shock protein [Cochleicola gelatinilyticus]|uniref:DNA-binding protein n=1 Tax=Cochleicola gelatinilyticus TaxID=1763537 RepID=A0A167GYD6_9FLAO|nr:cold shock domain-containing protein [Cochleicola gelatinilyticus]OAB78033.1 DNA-binding protein [Cochleicola gelatinilyticus]
MAGSQESYSKKEREKKKLEKRKEKQKRKEERQANSGGSSLEDMLVYVDHNGNLTDTPPDPSMKPEIDAEDIVLGIPPKVEGEEEDPVREGTVDFFDSSKGFGFIIDAENKERYFVHVSGLSGGEIVEGNRVQFELERGQKGLNAVRVKKV